MVQFSYTCLSFLLSETFYWVQIRDQKRAALLKEKRSSTGSSSAPRVIVSVFNLFSYAYFDSISAVLAVR